MNNFMDRMKKLAGSNPPVPDASNGVQHAGKVNELRGELKRARAKLSRQEEELAGLRELLAQERVGDQKSGVPPENMIWVFGSGRTGSSWMTFMMGSLANHSRWNEPLIGQLFGYLYYVRGAHRQQTEHFILGNHRRETWIDSIRTLLINGATERFPQRVSGGYLVIKEPHGALGAPLLMEALPESRMIFLVRDSRDVMASKRAAHKPGSWASETHSYEGLSETAAMRDMASTYSRDIQFAKQAFNQHDGLKSFVRYEDLRFNTLDNLKRIYSELEIPVDDAELARVEKKYAWENIPESQKGGDKIRRKAKPGGWSEDLSPELVEIVEEEAGWIIEEFYAGG